VDTNILAGNSSTVGLLSSNLEAYAARLQSVQNAKHSLNIMTYLWHEDHTGIALIEQVLKAAERGVKVRIILDGIHFPGPGSLFQSLNEHPNVEVRLYNPFKWSFSRRFLRIFELALRFRVLNLRMHNKAWIVDKEVVICGGRNIGDEYFGHQKLSNFADVDVVCSAGIAGECLERFNSYWHSPLVRPLALGNTGRYSELLKAAFHRQRSEGGAVDPRVMAILKQAHIPAQRYLVQHALVACDPPDKGFRLRRKGSRLTSDAVAELIARCKRTLTIVSPYFVPGRKVARKMAALSRTGVVIRILTNSLAATDAFAVHSGYVKFRRKLLRWGVKIWELKAEGRMRQKLGVMPQSRASLHAKCIVVDQNFVFVGSFNIDPRSLSLNSEMGIVFESPEIAQQLNEIFDEATHQDNSWRVRIEGHRLVWHEPQQNITYSREPSASLWRRGLVRIVSWFPIEWLL
jgi:putative cardiolipin synthase